MSALAGQIDSTFDVVTPENISFEYQMAGPLRRLPALLIDIAIRVAVFFGIGMLMMCLGIFTAAATMSGDGLVLGQGVMLLCWFGLEWFYGGLFETFWNGQTPGKRLTGIRVLSVQGKPINGMQAMIRNILRFVDAMPLIPFVAFAAAFGWDPLDPAAAAEAILFWIICPFPTYLIGLTVPATNARWQRLGDLVCGTMVIVEESSWMTAMVRIDDPRVRALAADLPPNVVVSRSLARALATYVERRKHFSEARRQEIAMHLGHPLIERFQLPPVGDHDLLLCALYWRVFVSENVVPSSRPGKKPRGGDPQADFDPGIVTGPLMERR